VKNIDKAFNHVKSQEGVRLISDSPDYFPYKIDDITVDEFSFFDESLENDFNEKEKARSIVGNIRYFYFIDKYGVQWEFEEGHSDIGD
jgi:methylmalonyl-CoA/ethylmalonyl-CoA epimerase